MAVHPVKSSPCTLLAKTDPQSYPLKTPPLIHPSPKKRAKNHPNPQAISGDSSLWYYENFLLKLATTTSVYLKGDPKALTQSPNKTRRKAENRLDRQQLVNSDKIFVCRLMSLLSKIVTTKKISCKSSRKNCANKIKLKQTSFSFHTAPPLLACATLSRRSRNSENLSWSTEMDAKCWAR